MQKSPSTPIAMTKGCGYFSMTFSSDYQGRFEDSTGSQLVVLYRLKCASSCDRSSELFATRSFETRHPGQDDTCRVRTTGAQLACMWGGVLRELSGYSSRQGFGPR